MHTFSFSIPGESFPPWRTEFGLNDGVQRAELIRFTRGLVNTFGVFQDYYESAILSTSTSSAISWIGTLQGFLLIVVGILTGPLFDRGYFRHLIFTGAFLVVFGMMMTSLCKTYYQIILAQGICVGIGTGCLFVPSVAIVATYFTSKRALMTGITAAGGSIGNTLGCAREKAFDLTHHRRGYHFSDCLPSSTA